MDTSKDIREKVQAILSNYGCSGGYLMPVDLIVEVFKEYIEEKYSSTISNNITGYKKDLLEGLEKEGYE